MVSPDPPNRIWTIPNVICGLRVLGIVPMLWAAREGHRDLFVWIVVALLLSDWIDGKLAILLDQRSALGARIDSAADLLMYAAGAVGLWWMEEAVIRAHAGWILAVGLTWGVSAAVSLKRFGRLPSYHTYGAKASWLAIGVATMLLLLRGDTWLLRWAMGLVVLTNLEAVGIGLVLPGWRTDVGTLRQAVRIRRQVEEAAP